MILSTAISLVLRLDYKVAVAVDGNGETIKDTGGTIVLGHDGRALEVMPYSKVATALDSRPVPLTDRMDIGLADGHRISSGFP